MTDLPVNGLSGAIGAAFVVGFQWAKSVLGRNVNGHNPNYITRAEYEARHSDIMKSLDRIETKVDHIRP